jgi:hypothetical protein
MRRQHMIADDRLGVIPCDRCTDAGDAAAYEDVNLWRAARFTQKGPWNGRFLHVVNLVNL